MNSLVRLVGLVVVLGLSACGDEYEAAEGPFSAPPGYSSDSVVSRPSGDTPLAIDIQQLPVAETWCDLSEGVSFVTVGGSCGQFAVESVHVAEQTMDSYDLYGQ